MSTAPTINPVTLNYAFLVSFREWLSSQNIAANTLRVYYSRVKQFLLFLEYSNLGDRPLTDQGCMTELMHLYVEYLHKCKAAAESINGNINALQRFSQFLGFEGKVVLKRARNCRVDGRVLNYDKVAALLHHLDTQASVRDKALCLALLYTGIRLADCANLSIDDVAIETNGDKRPGNSADTQHSPIGTITVLRSGGDLLVKLNGTTTAALSRWIQERDKYAPATGTQALWLNTHGDPLSTHGIAFIVRKIGWQSGLTLSPEMLRRTGLAHAAEQLTQTGFASTFGGTASRASMNRFGFTAGLPERPEAA